MKHVVWWDCTWHHQGEGGKVDTSVEELFEDDDEADAAIRSKMRR